MCIATKIQIFFTRDVSTATFFFSSFRAKYRNTYLSKMVVFDIKSNFDKVETFKRHDIKSLFDTCIFYVYFLHITTTSGYIRGE